MNVEAITEQVEQIKRFGDESAKAGFSAGWNAALEQAAAVAESYPEGFGDEYVAHGLIGKGQDDAARDIAAAIRELIQS